MSEWAIAGLLLLWVAAIVVVQVWRNRDDFR